MAEKYVRIGSFDRMLYDDTDFDSALYTDHQIEVEEAPSSDYNIIRLIDLKNKLYPVGTIYMTTRTENPADILGFGTWTRIAAKFLAGYSSGDPDFGTLKGSGGSRTHSHMVDPPSTTTSGPSSSTIVQPAITSAAASTGHTHDVDIPPFDSYDNTSIVVPYYVVNIWERTA